MTDTESFELTVRMDATVTIVDSTGQTNWLKPGTEVSHTWKGMPTPEEVALRYSDMSNILSSVLEEQIALVHQKTRHGL